MDQTVKRIIDIDRDTIKLKEKTIQLMEEKQVEFDTSLEELEEKYINKYKAEGEKIYNEIIKEGGEIVEARQRKENKNIKDLENLYNKKKKDLIEILWRDLFIEE